ncbi:MAG: glycoside hydrolase family 1 protein, partial [Myxococcales bacterium]|nr:glycoside hydrolase family 1 protein [Myxococcales bacterium]
MRRAIALAACAAALLACDDSKPAPAAPPPAPPVWSADGPLIFSPMASLSQPAGRHGFRFGAATAAAQIEEGITAGDWHWWTLPEAEGGRGQGAAPVGQAVQGYRRALDDVGLLTGTNLEAYRLNIPWARVEPTRDAIDEAALAHYDAVLDALVAAGVRPMLTVHHFSNPIWAHDFRQPDCPDDAEPTDANLCGWAHPKGQQALVAELAEFAGLLAARYGDRVDEWCTINEPINYLLAAYGAGMFPPGKSFVITDFERLMGAYVAFLDAHAAVARAIRENDTVDADGDGRATDIGLSLSVADWQPARGGMPSSDPEDIQAAEKVWYIYHHLYPDALRTGAFDRDLDGTPEEPHPGWAGTLDWLGVQYYFRAGVTGRPALIRAIGATPCFGGILDAACLPVSDETKWVPTMGYEFYEPGLHTILTDLGGRYPDLPLVVTEAGIAAENGVRRAENVVRTLEQIARAMAEGVDVRGYYHWSLMDNFEWAE